MSANCSDQKLTFVQRLYFNLSSEASQTCSVEVSMRFLLIFIAVLIVKVVSLRVEKLSEIYARNFDVYTGILNAKLQLLQKNVEGK